MNRILFASLLVIGCALAQVAYAQSTEQELPTPVLTNDINGRIAALDVGDPRATRHFYAFAASPGDLLITVDARNLNGDIDVFTAITFRPLMKTTVYASTQSPNVTKGIYLRAHQLLILRVEARSPSDEAGTYHIHFGGTFEPFSGGIPVAENTDSPDNSNAKSGANRLSSVGATLPKPPVEISETAEAKPSPSREKAEEKSSESSESSEAKPVTSTKTATNRPTTRPPRRSTRNSPSRRQPPPKKTESTAKQEGDVNTEPKTEPATVEPAKPQKSVEEKSAEVSEKSSEGTSPGEKPKPQEAAAQPLGARLIIEEKDGTRIERPMSTVRRVIVEGTTIVVVLKTGKIERISMSDVAKMAIEPQ